MLDPRFLFTLILALVTAGGPAVLEAGEPTRSSALPPAVHELACDPVDRMVWAVLQGDLISFPESAPDLVCRHPLGRAPGDVDTRRVDFAFDRTHRYIQVDSTLWISRRALDSKPGVRPCSTDVQPAAQDLEALCSDGCKVFAVHRSGGLVTYAQGKPVALPWGSRVVASRVKQIAADSAGLAVLTSTGVDWYDHGKQSWTGYPIEKAGVVWMIHPHRSMCLAHGHVAVATALGVERIHLATGIWERYHTQEDGNPHAPITMLQAESGVLFSTYTGFYRMTKGGWIAQRLEGSVYAMAEERPFVWIGTHGSNRAGLWRLGLSDGRYRKTCVATRTNGTNVFSVAVGRQNVFVGADRGIARVEKETGLVHPVVGGEDR